MKIYSSTALRQWDQFTIKNEPISSIDLMERAGRKLAEYILENVNEDNYDIFCGIGNNGGDGLVIARILQQNGVKVHLYIVEFSTKRSEEFSQNLRRLPKEIPIHYLNSENCELYYSSNTMIDAIFGSGLNKPIADWVKSLVIQLNKQYKQCISIDIPSGLFADDNRLNDFNAIIRATLTLSLQVPKMAFFYKEYAYFIGNFKTIDIALLSSFSGDSTIEFVEQSDVRLKVKDAYTHKGNNGYLFFVGGFNNMGGAAVLACKAAFRSGCGYVGLHSDKTVYPILLQECPETLFIENVTIPQKATSIAIGPGMGVNDESIEMLKNTLNSDLPMVIDADALNLMSTHSVKPPPNAILTPHLNELRRLIGDWSSPEECLEMQKHYSIKHHVYIIQKGHYSKLTTPDGKIYINSTGNAGMAKAGMGDTLTGIIASFLAQGYSPFESARIGMYVHGKAADIAVKHLGELSLLPSDVINYLPEVYYSLKKS